MDVQIIDNPRIKFKLMRKVQDHPKNNSDKAFHH